MRARLFALSFLSLLLLLTSTPVHAEHCRCNSPDQVDAYDQRLLDLQAEPNDVIDTELPLGIPTSEGGSDEPEQTSEFLLVTGEYVDCYDSDLLIPIWGAYVLTAADASAPGHYVTSGGKKSRIECFRTDPRLEPEEQSTCADYKDPAKINGKKVPPEKTFDQGHLCPAGDFHRTREAELDTYLLSNMTPQYKYFNEDIWRFFEAEVRQWGKDRGEIIVMTGVTLDRNGDHKRDPDDKAKHMLTATGPSKMAIPTGYWKVVLARRSDGGYDHIAVLLPHKTTKLNQADSLAAISKAQTTIDEIEARTGLDLFADLPDDMENEIESQPAQGTWPLVKLSHADD